MSIQLDQDCLITIFEHLSMGEKLKCRLVCSEWRAAVDKLTAGQQYLEIYAVNSSIVAAAAKASGTEPAQLTTSAKFEALLGYIRYLWTLVDTKLLPELPSDGQDDSSRASEANQPKELDLLAVCSPNNLIYLSSYYWNYAFCASSSLFSSYSFAMSTITTHQYLHSFCDCYPRQRHKYSVMFDRDRLSFRAFHNLLNRFSNIQSIVIRNVDHLSDSFLFMLTRHCPAVQSLTLTNCSYLEKEGENRHSSFNCLTDCGWRLLSAAYPKLTSLTLRQCKLTEAQLTIITRNCSSLCFLDISDNIQVGKSVRYLGPSIKCLICGDLSSDESIETIVSNIAFGNGRHVEYLSLFGSLGSLKPFSEFRQLSHLELHYFTDEELPAYLADIGMLSLTSLVLEQIRCYESPSALNHTQFVQMLQRCSRLRRLQITGDFDWNLRLTDESLQKLTTLCPGLQELTLNGNGSLSDYGIVSLVSLPLLQLSLSSFHAITDYSIQTLLKNVATLRQVTLVDMPQITHHLITKAVSICATDVARKISITLSDEQHQKYFSKLDCPPNLAINFDSHLCGKQFADSEPTDIQMLLIILMSAVILGMTLLTTVVVILVPLSMLLMMAHEYLIELFFTNFEGQFLAESYQLSCDTNKLFAFLLSSIQKFLTLRG